MDDVSIYGGSGDDSITYTNKTGGINNSLVQDTQGDTSVSIDAQIFNSSSVVSGEGKDTISITSGNTVEKGFVNSAAGNDSITLTASLENSTIGAGSGNDSLTVVGGLQGSTLFGGAGSDTITATVGANQLLNSVIKDSSGENVYKITSSNAVENISVTGGSFHYFHCCERTRSCF